MPRAFRFMLFACFLVGPFAGCREEVVLPPKKSVSPKPESHGDVTKFARFKADVDFTVPYLTIMFEEDAADPAWMRMTLASSQAGPDGARLFLQSLEKVRTLTEMKSESIDFSSLALLDVRGNGFFTPTTAYQPKLVSLRVSDFDDKQISGTISGEFYKFRMKRPRLKPEVIKGEATFTAARVAR